MDVVEKNNMSHGIYKEKSKDDQQQKEEKNN